jgi:hypothetical protein
MKEEPANWTRQWDGLMVSPLVQTISFSKTDYKYIEHHQ